MSKILNKILMGAGILFMALFIVGGGNQALAASSLAGQEQAIINYTNQIRNEAGLSELEVDNRLMQSALYKAQDMADKGYFAHTNPDGHRMSYWINGLDYHYTLAGENLAKGFTSVDSMLQAWVDSPTHYRNLVETEFTDIGVGVAARLVDGKEIVFVVQHFANEIEVVRTASIENIINTELAQAASVGLNGGAINIEVDEPKGLTLGEVEDVNSSATILPVSELTTIDISSDRDKPADWVMALLAIASLGIVGYTVDMFNLTKLKDLISFKRITKFAKSR